MLSKSVSDKEDATDCLIRWTMPNWKVLFIHWPWTFENHCLLLLLILVDKLDEEVIQDGVKIFIDKKAQLSLLGKKRSQNEHDFPTIILKNVLLQERKWTLWNQSCQLSLFLTILTLKGLVDAVNLSVYRKNETNLNLISVWVVHR